MHQELVNRKLIYKRIFNSKLHSLNIELPELQKNLKLNSGSILNSIENYIYTNIDLFCIPTFAFEINKLRILNSLKGNSSNERYVYYLNNYSIFDMYPHLLYYLNIFIDSSINSFKEIIINLNNDWKDIKEKFNIQNNILILENINTLGNADRHNGKQAVVLEFNNNFKLFYKPINLNNELLIENIFNFVNKYSKDNFLKNYIYLTKDDHLYREFIDYTKEVKNKEEIKNFYLKLGKILGITYITNTTDIHMENIVVNNANPYLIDRETFFHDNSLLGFNSKNEIYSSGILKIPNENQSIYEEGSALFGGIGKRLSLLKPFIFNDETDSIYIKYINLAKFDSFNRIYFKNKLVNPIPYSKYLVTGFEESKNIFIKNKKEIYDLVKSHSKIYNRQIIRRTALYYGLIQQIFQPQNLLDNKFKEKIYKKLKDNFGGYNSKAKKLAKIECEEIFKLNIPYFYSSMESTDIYSIDGNISKNFFSKTGYKKFNDKLDKTNSIKLDKLIKQIKLSFTV